MKKVLICGGSGSYLIVLDKTKDYIFSDERKLPIYAVIKGKDKTDFQVKKVLGTGEVDDDMPVKFNAIALIKKDLEEEEEKDGTN